MEETSIKTERKIDRLDKYMKASKLNDNKITLDLGLSVGTIGKSRADGRDLSNKVIEKVLNFYPDLNAVWLLTGEGDMIRGNVVQQVEHVDGGSVIGRIGGNVNIGGDKKYADFEAEIKRLKNENEYLREQNDKLLELNIKLTSKLLD